MAEMRSANAEKVKIRMGISTRVMPGQFVWHPIHIEVGPVMASIRLDRHDIRFPEPWDENGLTNACRDLIVEAVKHQSEMDGLQRQIVWGPSAHHGEQHG